MKYLSDYLASFQSEAMNKNEAFFSFSKKRFDEQKKENVTYVSMFGGLLCPKENVNQFKKDLDTAINEAVKLDVA